MILIRRDPSRAQREKRLDALWQKIIKTRDDYRCQRCGAQGKLDAAHIITRSRKLTKWTVANGVTLCSGCHMHFHRNPAEFLDWVDAEWFRQNGDYCYNDLRIMSQPGRTKLDMGMIEAQLKARARVYGIHI